jgi:hypothetical protein
VILLLSCLACLGQSRFDNQIEPGHSTRADVDSTLGEQLCMFQANQSEYRAPGGASRLVVLYRSSSDNLELSQVDFDKPYTRAAILESLWRKFWGIGFRRLVTGPGDPDFSLGWRWPGAGAENPWCSMCR